MRSICLVGLLAAGCGASTHKSEPEAPDSGPSEEVTARPVPTITTDPRGLSGSDPVVCEDPDARTRLGPTEPLLLGPDWERQEPTDLGGAAVVDRAAGLAVADFTGDGLLDVFVAHRTPCLFFEGQPDGTLVERSTERLPAPTEQCDAWGASAADIDLDGDLDLYVTREGARDRLLLNDGTGHFVDHTDAAGLPELACGSRSASWGDIDLDGDLDLFVARHRVITDYGETSPCPDLPAPTGWSMPGGDPNSLLINRGDGTFRDASVTLPYDTVVAFSFIGGFIDVDDDLDVDLMLVNDFGGTSVATSVLRNDGTGDFTPVVPASGGALRIFGMGTAFGDVNEDGLPDILLTDIENLHLLKSLEGGGWYDDATRVGLVPDWSAPQLASWGVAFEDLDNDADLDVLTVFGPTEDRLDDPATGVTEQPDALFLQDDDGFFADEAAAWGLDSVGSGRGLVVTDFDGDGWLDIFRPDYRGGPAAAIRQRCGEAAWLTVRLDAPGFGVGARITVDAGGQRQHRWMVPGSTSLASSGPPVVHVGLGDADTIDQLVVRWPNGDLSQFTDIDARRHLTVHHPSRIADADTGTGG